MSIPADDLHLLNQCRHYNPHGLYGWHDGTVHTRRPGAQRVELVTATDVIAMRNLGDDIFFAELKDNEDYRLRITYPAQPPRDVADGYRFLPTLGSLDLHLISEGRHERLWDVLGANIKTFDSELGSITGTAFAVWAPNAEGVSVVGDFCGWNAAQYPMRSLGSTGIWEVFIPGIGAGERYKFAIQTKDGHRIDKADPMARKTLAPPETASIIEESSYQWNDEQWLQSRNSDLNVPMSVYEVHVGS